MRIVKVAALAGAVVLLASGATVAGAKTLQRDRVMDQTCVSAVKACDQLQVQARDCDRLQDGTCASVEQPVATQAAKRTGATVAAQERAQSRVAARTHARAVARQTSRVVSTEAGTPAQASTSRTRTQSTTCDPGCDCDQDRLQVRDGSGAGAPE